MEGCPKSSWLCFNEFKDVCSTRMILILNKKLTEAREVKE
jgi:hypothetical protein